MEQIISDFVNFVDKVDTATTTSVASFSKVSVIQSPMYISEQLHDEPAIKNIVSNLYNIYTGYILSCLQLDQRVTGTKTIRDILSTVSTEIVGTNESFASAESLASKLSGALEVTYSTIEPKKMDLPVGKVIDLEISAADGKIIHVPLTIRFNPRIVPESIVEYIVGADFSQSVSQRWLQMKAGEISFVKDFIFQMDKLDRRATALKNDKGNVLADIYRHKNKSHIRHLLKVSSMYKGSKNTQANLACSVFLFDAEQIARLTKKRNINLFKLDDRRRFFMSTYALFCVLVDTNYSRVHILTNGIDDIATYSFNELKSKNQDDDIKDFLDTFAKGQLPKF